MRVSKFLVRFPLEFPLSFLLHYLPEAYPASTLSSFSPDFNMAPNGRRRREYPDPEPFYYDKNKVSRPQTPETESISFTSITVSPSKRARTRYARSKHDVALPPSFNEPIQAPSSPFVNDASIADVDMDIADHGMGESSEVHIHEDDVPASRRSHVSSIRRHTIPRPLSMELKLSRFARLIRIRSGFHTGISSCRR